MVSVIKIRDNKSNKVLINRDDLRSLKSKVIVLNVEESVIAKSLKISEKGVYGVKT